MSEVINIMRHESVFNPAEHKYPCHVIGAGATGSRVFAALVELGMTDITVYDDDVIEEHNLANQIYTYADIGENKTLGCARFAKAKLGIEDDFNLPSSFRFFNRKVNPAFIANDGVQGGIVFILTDTMESRKQIFEALMRRVNKIINDPTSTMRHGQAPLLIIETRMASTHGSVYTVNPFDAQAREAWLKTLVDDTDEDNIELSPCGTTLSVGTTASLIANYAVWQMMQFFVDPAGLQPQVDLFFKPTLTITSPTIAA